MNPGPQPHNAGLAAGWVHQKDTLEARLARVERIVERLGTMAEKLAEIVERIQLTPVGAVLAELDAENRRLRAELAQHAKSKR